MELGLPHGERDRPGQAEHVPDGAGRIGLCCLSISMPWPARATGGSSRRSKRARRVERRDAVADADQAVVAADGHRLAGMHRRRDRRAPRWPRRRAGASVGTLPGPPLHLQVRLHRGRRAPRRLCPARAASNHAKRDARTDLTGRRARHRRPRQDQHDIALRLFRDGAHTTITTRLPHDAVRRFTAPPTAPTGCTGSALSASTFAIRPRSSRSRTPWPPQGRWTS